MVIVPRGSASAKIQVPNKTTTSCLKRRLDFCTNKCFKHEHQQGTEHEAGTKEAVGGTTCSSHQAVCGFRPSPPSPLPKHPNMLDVTLYIFRITDYFQKLG